MSSKKWSMKFKNSLCKSGFRIYILFMKSALLAMFRFFRWKTYKAQQQI